MKTIKDILKADSYEQRRRIANNLAINRDDKNALITNQSEGGGSDINETIYYYKTKRSQSYNTQDNPVCQLCGDVEFLVTYTVDGNIAFPVSGAIGWGFGHGDGRQCVGFAFSNKKTPVFMNPQQGIYTYVKGSFEERIKQMIQLMMKAAGAGASYEEVKEAIYNQFNVDEFYENCTQITKEEYEALITNKPIE